MLHVALYTSAWIEISQCGKPKTLKMVALYTSAWIEMAKRIYAVGFSGGRTLHECVDWNFIKPV